MKVVFYFLCCLCLFAVGCRKENGNELIMVTEATFPPYEFRVGGNIVGVDPDIVRAVADELGYRVVIEDIAFDSVIPAVQTRRADIAASGITITEERKKQVLFSIPYMVSAQVIIVPANGAINDVEDLKTQDVAIGVQHGTTGDIFVTKNIREPERYANGALAVAALKAGKIQAVVLDSEPAKVHVAQHSNLKILPEPLVLEEYAFAFNQKDVELCVKVNDVLSTMLDNGEIDAILNYYSKLQDHEAGEIAAVASSGLLKILYDLKQVFVEDNRYMYLVKGFFVTLEIAFCAVLLGLIIGFAVAVVRCTADQTGELKYLDFLCRVYLTIIRGTPVVVQLLIIYFVIFGSLDVSKVLVAVVAFGINSGAYVAEIIRGGINSIDPGQMEAGRSLGLSYSRTMGFIVLPQALKNVLPALGNEFIVLLKETSVAGYIALQDLTKAGDIIRSQTYDAFLPLMAVALIYLAVVMLLSWLLGRLETRLKRNE